LENRPRIAITMGDPAGVGPEIIVKMFQDRSVYNFSCPLIVGDATFLNEVALKLASSLSIIPIPSPQESSPGRDTSLSRHHICLVQILRKKHPPKMGQKR